MDRTTKKISLTLPDEEWDRIEKEKGGGPLSVYVREALLNKSETKDGIYFIDDQHEQNFQKVLERWPSGQKNTEYRAACYILSVPMLFDKVGHMLNDFQNPTDWIWRWEWKYTVSKQYDELDDEEREEAEREIPYDLTGSMVQMGRLALNMWNGYDNFNLMHCMASLDEENYKVLMCAMNIRMRLV